MKNIEIVKERIANIIATNKNDIYNSHLYWSQKPYNICDVLIEELTKEGEVIFDPFMGSGVTIIEAIKSNYKRKAIGCDINEVPIFIVTTLLDKYNINQIAKYINNFTDEIKELNYLYKTKCKECNSEHAMIDKVIFDRENWKETGEIKEIHYKCNCSTKQLKKDADEDDKRKFKLTDNLNNICLDEFIENSRIAAYKGENIKNIFSKRNMFLLDSIIGKINNVENDKIKNCLEFIVLSSLHSIKITDIKSNSQWPLWTPKQNCVEKNGITIFNKKCSKFIKALMLCDKELDENRKKVLSFDELTEGGEYFIINEPIQNINSTVINKESVSLVITDPPYLGQVLYSEYMQLYKPFLNLKFNLEDEIVVSTAPSRNKTEYDYYELMQIAFINISQTLKNDGYMCMYFHDSNLKVWNRLIEIMNNSNLEYLTQVHITKSKNTLKNILSPKKSLSGDALIFFKKSKNIKHQNKVVNNYNEIDNKINSVARKIIFEKGYATTPELYDNGVIEFIINEGILNAVSNKYKDLTEIFEKEFFWDSENGIWILDRTEHM